MAGPLPRRRRLVLGLVAAMSISLGSISVATAEPAPAWVPATTAVLPAWDGSVDLYRAGTFTTQRSWLWCTAAGVQIVRNIVEHRTDHTTSGQRRYFDWMRTRNRYDLPESAGVDPAGWTAGLRHFVDDRYRLVASASFDGALRLATKRLRATGLPVALTVANGGHGWILTGFSATADPLVNEDFEVTSVRIVGPLYGRQSRNGYDMKPGTSLTPKQLRRFFTPWRYAPKAMVWDGRYVSIQPVPDPKPKAAPAAPNVTLTPAPTAAAPTAPIPAGAIASPPALAAALPRAPSRPASAAAASDHGAIVVAEGTTVSERPIGDSAVVLAMVAVLLSLVALVAMRQRVVARSPRTKE